MRHFYKILSFVLALICVFSLVGCITTPSTPKQNEKPNIPTNPVPSESVSGWDAIAKIADFVDDKGENVLYSPLSLNFALALISEGAKDSVKEDFEKYFGVSFDEYIKFYRNYIASLDDTVEVANSFWARNDEKSTVTLRPAFKEAIIKDFDAEIDSLPFDQAFVERVNSWCAEKTHQMIPKIYDNPPEKADSVIINALYFKGLWDVAYDDNQIRNLDFTFLDGSKARADFLHSSESIYLENGKATGFMKYYKGDRYAFVGILPKTEGNFKFSDLDLKSLIESKRSEDNLIVEIPQFEFDTRNELLDAVDLVGLQSIKNPGAFDKIAQEDTMRVTNIFQLTKIKLDKEGTEAAAVTVIEMTLDSWSADPVEYKYVYLNRPFAFMIYDTQTDTVLFIGKVVDPTTLRPE